MCTNEVNRVDADIVPVPSWVEIGGVRNLLFQTLITREKMDHMRCFHETDYLYFRMNNTEGKNMLLNFWLTHVSVTVVQQRE